MPDLVRDGEGAIALLSSILGTSWPNPWAPNGSDAWDDCAMCMSWSLFGLPANGAPFFTLVSSIQNWGRTQGIYHDGSAGIQRGDVIGFLWPGSDDNYSHTEIALGGVDGNGNITSLGTNSNPGDDLRVRTRTADWIVSYIRPVLAAPVKKEEEEETMDTGRLVRIIQDSTSGKTVKGSQRVYFIKGLSQAYWTKDEAEIYHIGRTTGLLKPGGQWTDMCDGIDQVEFNALFDESKVTTGQRVAPSKF